MSSNSAPQLHAIPTDIARLIIEDAAQHSVSVAARLSSVCKQAQEWSDPFLFQNIPAQNQLLPSELWHDWALIGDLIESMTSPFTSPRLKAARQFVNTIFILTNINMISIITILNDFPNIHSLAISGDVLPYECLQIMAPSLRRLMFSLPSTAASTRGPSFLSPIFLTLTHIDLSSQPYKDWAHWNWDGLSNLTSLTHFALGCLRFSRGPSLARGSILRVAEALPSSVELFLVKVEVVTLTQPAFDALRDGSLDLRLVISVSSEKAVLSTFEGVYYTDPWSETQQWCGCGSDDDDWSGAMEIVKARKREVLL